MVIGNDPEMMSEETPCYATCGGCLWCANPRGCLSREDDERLSDFGLCMVDSVQPVLVRLDWTPSSGMPCGGDYWGYANG